MRYKKTGLVLSRKQKLVLAALALVGFGVIGVGSYYSVFPQSVEYQKYLVLSKLAEEGNSADQRLLAEYFYGKGDFKSSLEWEQKAAQAGDAGAQNFMGLYFGHGINPQLTPETLDYSRAREWFEKAAAQDYPTSQAQLCIMYSKGNGVPVDNELAYFWCSISKWGEPVAGIRQSSREALDDAARQRVETRIASWLQTHRANP